MDPVSRVLDTTPVSDLAAYEAAGGGRAVATARDEGGDATLAVIDASGLRGRGGAGFPTATKWRSILEHRTTDLPPTVVVNAAEGEPGTFKDRAIIRANPYRVLEGALVAAMVVGADEVVVATKASFEREVRALRLAAQEIVAAGWARGISIDVVEGPDEYLYGEETAMLEVIDGRLPFPRIAPPWRRGIDDPASELAPPGDALEDDEAGTMSAPTLVNNVETMANVALIVANGPEWFREVGTEDSPGTIVCTITGDLPTAGVVEVPMGTLLSDVLHAIGGKEAASLIAVLPGVSGPAIPADRFDTPLTHEAIKELGSSLGTAGFIAIGKGTHPVAVAQGVSRFLAVESCGQCTPCKSDGKAISVALGRVRDAASDGSDLATIETKLRTVETGARCFLASQQQQTVSSLLALFPDEVAAQVAPGADPAAPYLIAELVDLVDGGEGIEAVLDERHGSKQPDWSFDEIDSGQSPADRFDQREAGGASS